MFCPVFLYVIRNVKPIISGISVSQRLCPHVFLISKTPRSLDFGINSFNQNYKGRLCPPIYIKVAIGV